MDLADSPSEAAFRADARAWLAEHRPPSLGMYDEGADDELIVKAGRAWQRTLYDGGWAAITWPREYGGRGLGPVEQIVWNQELTRAGVPRGVSIQAIGMAGPTIIAHGTEEQKERLLEPILRGDELWCQLFSEPDAGSDLASLTTRAERTPDGWIVNGQKTWSSGAHYADRGILIARTGPGKHDGLTYFLLDMRTPGVEVRPLRQITGAVHFNEVFLDDVAIPDADRLGDVGAGWTVARTTLLHERMSLGGVEGLFSFASVANAIADGGPVVRQRLAELYCRTRCLELLNARVITKLGRGRIPESEGSIMKLVLSFLVSDGAALALDANAIAGAADRERWMGWVMSPAMHIGGGTDEIQRNIIAERVLGLPRDH